MNVVVPGRFPCRETIGRMDDGMCRWWVKKNQTFEKEVSCTVPQSCLLVLRCVGSPCCAWLSLVAEHRVSCPEACGSFPSRDGTHGPCVGKQIPNTGPLGKSNCIFEEVCSSLVFSLVTRMDNHPHCLISEDFHHPQNKPCAQSAVSPH